MRYEPTIDVRRLPEYAQGTEGTLWWGMMGMIAVETAVFGALVASYFYLKSQAATWPLGGFDAPAILLPTINTVLLVASSFVMHWADKGLEVDDQRRLRLGMLGATALAATFLVLKVVEYADAPYRWDTNAYGSIVWTIIGFHSAHLFVLIIKSSIVATLAIRGFFTPRRRLGVIMNGLYWHFVVAIWVPLYLVLYWSPRLS